MTYIFQIKYATYDDKHYWYSLDEHIRESEFELKVHAKRCFIIYDGEKNVGIMRYNLFLDEIPFLTLVYFEESYRGKGYGKKSIEYWENKMRQLNYKIVMTSTRVDEKAQHFYRKLGYKDNGCLVMNISSFEQPLEMFLIKLL